MAHHTISDIVAVIVGGKSGSEATLPIWTEFMKKSEVSWSACQQRNKEWSEGLNTSHPQNVHGFSAIS
jgi:hypothetical protein